VVNVETLTESLCILDVVDAKRPDVGLFSAAEVSGLPEY
jgi:hypothetical protein